MRLRYKPKKEKKMHLAALVTTSEARERTAVWRLYTRGDLYTRVEGTQMIQGAIEQLKKAGDMGDRLHAYALAARSV